MFNDIPHRHHREISFLGKRGYTVKARDILTKNLIFILTWMDVFGQIISGKTSPQNGIKNVVNGHDNGVCRPKK
jgi:hypothetical protein